MSTKAKFAAALLVLAPSAFAGWGLQLHVASVQLSQRVGVPWNGGNDGFAVRYSFNETMAIQAGHYRNEFTAGNYNLFTNYVYGDYTPINVGALRLGAFAGVVSGYDEVSISNGRTVGMREVGKAFKGGLVGRYQWHQISAALRLNPAMPNAGPASLAVEVGFDF